MDPYDTEGSRIADPSRALNRRSVLRATGTTMLGLGVATAGAGTAAATEPCTDCVFLGKVEFDGANWPAVGDTWSFEYNGTEVTIEVVDLRLEDGELVAIEFFSGPSETICKTVAKGGPTTVTREWPESGARQAWVYAPAHVNPKTGKRHKHRSWYALSNVSFYYCVP